jgi:hypothetical protein
VHTPSTSSLVVGERVVSRSEDGLLHVEYALFSAGDALLAATPGMGVREQGYLTTAGYALERLVAAGITPELAGEAFDALSPELVRSLARIEPVAALADALGPTEAFEGRTYVAATKTYLGAWLDVEALASACPLPDAPLLLQALHLVGVVAEVAEDVPVRLFTASPGASRKPGERTWRRVELDKAWRLPAVLRGLHGLHRGPATLDLVAVRDELLKELRERARVCAAGHEGRLRELSTRLARGSSGSRRPPPVRPSVPPPVSVHVDAIPRPPLSSRVTPPSFEAPAPIPAHTPTPPGIGAVRAVPTPPLLVTDGPSRSPSPPPIRDQLRKHAGLLQGEGHLRSVAQFLSAMADESAPSSELALMAARAWLAAGETAHARFFARGIVDDPQAPEGLRTVAREILDTTTATTESMLPPPRQVPPAQELERRPPSDAPRAALPGASLPPFVDDHPTPDLELGPPAPPAAKGGGGPELDVVVPAPAAAPAPARASAPPHPPHPPTSVVVAPAPQAPPASAAAPPAVSAAAMPSAPFGGAKPELVESLSMPDGATEDFVVPGALPRTPLEARVAFTRLSRELAREMRLSYGVTLRTDPQAIDALQRHLRRRFSDFHGDAKRIELELRKHGALLSEILARSLGARWIDLAGEELGHWAMTVPPGVRVWPFGRVFRFYQRGHRESDLVSFYFELEAHARRAVR